ncbi:M3 family metallopeptidase [Novosphingobium sp. Gsoil 351]|uniref:M3 family metallopeptidase n=1 Tax=Novosphingobium sp. Gsoil 351 TaxID=2675225 RepID=UPI0012B4778F|nr:M3 family metallopeptidase [Novosphingobium sp. Gsoil 351]QGN53326.1 hypothetical protein GKE62_00930 [Novosphingobium sp. Gsoil 351]
MRNILTGALLATTLLASPAAAKPNAADTFIGNILTDVQDAGTIKARCDQFVGEIDRRQAALEREGGKASLKTTLQGFDDLSNMIGAFAGEATLYREAMGDDARRSAGADCEVRAAAAASKLGLSRPIYDRLKAIDPTKADAGTRLYLARTLAAYERAGIAKPEAERKRVQALQDRISELGTQFEKNIADGRKTIKADPAELAGLPADFIAAHRPGADGRVTIATDTPDYVPVMTYAQSEPLRRRLFEAYQTRAYPANDQVLREMLDKRQELATMLGRPDFATLVLEDKMLDRPAKVEDLLAEMSAAAKPAAERDYAKKLALWKKMKPGATRIDPWNNGFLGNLIQKQDYALDRQELRKYFAYDDVRDGILKLTQDLFGVKIRPWNTTKWDPSVETYEVLEKGRVIGRMYLDSHPRPGKYQHANMVPLRSGVKGRTIPVAALVMNLPAGDHATGLMEHGDVVTFLHEYGHMLHGIFGGQSAVWAAQSGVTTEWDFVEAPSQMLEEWVYDYDTLRTFGRDAAGTPIAKDLVATLNKARYFDIGIQDMRQIGLSNISLGLHRSGAPAQIGARTRELFNVYDPIGYPDFVQMQDSFGHLNGYSAIYYTYRWSKVIADDMFTRFAREGLRNKTTAAAYRKLVLTPGGSKPAAELVQAFLGRPISLDAYKAEMAKDK